MELDFKLNDVLDKVNEAIEQSHAIVNNRVKMNNLSELKIRFDNMTLELITTKKQVVSYKQKYELMKKQSTESLSNDKIVELEEKISNVKEDNENLNKKIIQFKSKHTQKSKELESYQKEYPLKIAKLTEQLDNLATKKFKNFNKINNNKRSLKNLKVYLENVQKLCNNQSSKLGSNHIEIGKIQDVLFRLHDHLKIPEEELIIKINNGDVIFDDLPISHYHLNDLDRRKDSGMHTNPKHSRSLSPKHKNKVNTVSRTLPLIAPRTNYESPSKKPHLLSLNKFEYLAQKEMVTKPNYMKKNYKQKKFVEEKIKDEEDEKNIDNIISEVDETKESGDEIRRSFYTSSEEEIQEIKNLEKMDKILDLELKYDYEKATDEDFTYLVKKNEEFVALNEKILKLIKKSGNTYENKMKKGNKKQNEIVRRTQVLKQQNDLLSEEIKDLTRLLKLSYEERQLIKLGNNNESVEKDKRKKNEKIDDKKESKPILKQGYVFFTSRPPEFYLQKDKSKNKKNNRKSLNSSNISRIKEKSNLDSSMSNYENENNNDHSFEKTENNEYKESDETYSIIILKIDSKDKIDIENLNKIKKLKKKQSPNNSDVDINEIKKKYNLKDIKK